MKAIVSKTTWCRIKKWAKNSRSYLRRILFGNEMSYLTSVDFFTSGSTNHLRGFPHEETTFEHIVFLQSQNKNSKILRIIIFCICN